MPAALSTFAGSGQTVSAYNSANNTFTIAGNGSTSPFHMDDEPNDVTGRTLVFTNGAFPQFDFSGSFGDSTGLTRTTIIESSTAGQPGRTAYYAATNRFRGTEAVTPLQLWNVDWRIDSSDGSEGNSKESAFNIGGSPSSSDLNGRLIEFRGVSVEGAFADNVWHNQRARIINNPQRGFGLRLWMQLASNTLPFTVVVACAPATNPSGLVLLRGTTTPVASSLQYFANDLDANTTLTLSGLSAAGVGVFPSGGNVDNTTVALIDPVGNPGKLGTPFSGGSLVWGRLRTFRTQTINYSGATFTGSEHLVISNSTASAPAWTNPANLTSNTDGVFAPVVAVKEVPHGTRNETTYANYSIYTVGMNYRRKADTFTLSSTTAPLTDQNITLTPETMADGSAITPLVIDNDNSDAARHADDLDKVFRAVKTHEVASPSHEMTDAYMINNAGTYEVKNGSGAAGTIQFSGVDHSLELNTSTTHITLYDLGGVTIDGGNADGLRAAGIQAVSSPTHGVPVLDFPRADTAGTTRRIRMTGEFNCRGSIFTPSGDLLAYQSRFRSVGARLYAQGLSSATGTFRWASTCTGALRLPARGTLEIASDSPLTVTSAMTIGEVATEAESGTVKYNATVATDAAGTATFSVDWSGSTPDPSATLNLTKATSARGAYCIFQSELNSPSTLGVEPTAGHEFLAAGGENVNYETFKSSGAFFMLGQHCLLRRGTSSDSSAALNAEAISPTGVWVDNSLGDVEYVPGISLTDIRTDLTALKTAVSTDFDTAQAGTQDLKTRLDTILTAVNNGGGGTLTASQVVDAIKAADFGSASGTQTLETILGAIQGAVVTDFDTSEAGTQTLKQRLDDLHASHGVLASAISNIPTPPTPPSTAQIVTAIQGADFGTAAGTQTLSTILNALTVLIGQRATNAGAAQATLTAMTTTDIDTSESGTQTVAGRLNAIKADTGNIASIKTTVEGLPTATNIVTAVYDKIIETNVDTEKALQCIMAVLFGKSTLNNDGNQVTWKRVDATEADIVRVSFDPDTGARSDVTIL